MSNQIWIVLWWSGNPSDLRSSIEWNQNNMKIFKCEIIPSKLLLHAVQNRIYMSPLAFAIVYLLIHLRMIEIDDGRTGDVQMELLYYVCLNNEIRQCEYVGIALVRAIVSHQRLEELLWKFISQKKFKFVEFNPAYRRFSHSISMSMSFSFISVALVTVVSIGCGCHNSPLSNSSMSLLLLLLFLIAVDLRQIQMYRFVANNKTMCDDCSLILCYNFIKKTLNFQFFFFCFRSICIH